MVINREYYPITEAAEKLNCSHDDLIHLAKNETINIWVLTGNGIALKQIIGKGGEVVSEKLGSFPADKAVLSSYCLTDYEAGYIETDAVLSIYFGDEPEVIKILDKRTGQPLQLKDCCMVLSSETIEQLRDKQNDKLKTEQLNNDLFPVEQLLNKEINNNDVAHSNILNRPLKADGWYDVIDDMVKIFYRENGNIPNQTQAWSQLYVNPPSGYEIETGIEKGEKCLVMPGVNSLCLSAFKKRWEKYTQ